MHFVRHYLVCRQVLPVFSVVKFALGTPVGGFSSGVVANV